MIIDYKLINSIESLLVDQNLSARKLNYYIDSDMDNHKKHLIGIKHKIRKHIKDFSYEIDEFLEIDTYFFWEVTNIDFLKIIYKKLLEHNNSPSFKSVHEMMEYDNKILNFVIGGIYSKIISKEIIKNTKLSKYIPIKKTFFGWKRTRNEYAMNGKSNFYEKFFK